MNGVRKVLLNRANKELFVDKIPHDETRYNPFTEGFDLLINEADFSISRKIDRLLEEHGIRKNKPKERS